MNSRAAAPRQFLERLYAAAIGAADPAAATQRAFSPDAVLRPNVRVLAVGKAARAMAAGAASGLRARGVEASASLIISAAASDGSAAPENGLIGDHPVPGRRSAIAADAIARFVGDVQPEDDVVVLVSGGTTSLIAAPVSAVTTHDLQALFRGLLASGVDIATTNAVRKRVLRWGAGRLAVALHPARVRCLIASDVIGNDLLAIGSGPCVPDPTTATQLLDSIAAHGIGETIPASVAEYLSAVAAGSVPETPKPGDRAFDLVDARVILDGSSALAGAASRAADLGVRVTVMDAPVIGTAADAGIAVARRLLEESRVSRRGALAPAAFMWWGETTVRLPRDAPAGGRCQELALACAFALHEGGDAASGITVLAAGTDGRDGPTDAAGAVVDASTWGTIAGMGRDPARDLASHSSYAALDAAGALFRTGPTGTNVNDLVLALIEPRAAA